MRYPRSPDWTRQWRDTRLLLGEVRALYADRSDDNRVLVARVGDLLVSCWHVYDWIMKDDASLPTVTKTVVDAHVTANEVLGICRAFANTKKHFDRDWPNALRARVDDHRRTLAGDTVSIAYWSASRPEQSIDALDLAQQCYAAWRELLEAHGATVPD